MGKCFDTTTKECTDQPCTLGTPCPTANQVCTLQCPPPTPQCSGLPCSGSCVVPFPCPAGKTCNGPDVPVFLGQCEPNATGGCDCVALPTPTAGPPSPTPTPQCSGATCGGPCLISFPCPPGGPCPEMPIQLGQCASTTSGACECERVGPTPAPTPPPQCNSAACGGSCVIVPPCTLPGPCPNFVISGQCGVAADGSCQCVPGPPPTPVCVADADCNDNNPCTADRCLNGACEHDCICLTAAGGGPCCTGPSSLCVAPCGTDAAGTCGGFCPVGATCETLANAACGCVSGPGGPCGGNVFAPAPVCAPGLVCQQRVPDAMGYCEKANCVPLFSSGCSQTSDCCEPCENGTRAPCGACINGTCEGAP
jgi:hypothetical protein